MTIEIRAILQRAYAVLVLYEMASEAHTGKIVRSLQDRCKIADRRRYLTFAHRELYPFADPPLEYWPPPRGWDQFLDPTPLTPGPAWRNHPADPEEPPLATLDSRRRHLRPGRPPGPVPGHRPRGSGK